MPAATVAAARRFLTALGLRADAVAQEETRLAAGLRVLQTQADEEVRCPDALCMVDQGRIQLVVHAGGHELVAATLGRTAFFEFTAVFGVPLPEVRARALTEAVVVGAPGDLVRAVLHDYPEALGVVLAFVVARTVAIEKLLVLDIRRGGVRRRLLDLLLALELEPAQQGSAERRVVAQPVHTEIADRIGARRETVTRLLGRLQTEGLIRRDGHALLFDPERLAAASGGSRAD